MSLAAAAAGQFVRRGVPYVLRRFTGPRRIGAAAAAALVGGTAVNYAAYQRGKTKGVMPITKPRNAYGAGTGAKRIKRAIKGARPNRTPYYAASGGEFQTPISIKVGSKKKPTVGALQKMSMETRVSRFQRLNPMNRQVLPDDIPGRTLLHNDILAGSTTVPVHFYCLNQVINNSLTTNGPAHFTSIADDGSVSFPQLTGLTAGSSNAYTSDWQIESQDNVGAVTIGKRYMQHDWYDCKFLCYGAKSQPTKFEISVVKFTEDYLDPLETPSSTKEQDHKKAHYQGLARQMMVNPILPPAVGRNFGKGMTVIKRQTFTLQPTLNTELDVTPASRVVKMFIRDGKVYDYLYQVDPFTGAGADNKLNDVSFDTFPTTSLEYFEHPKPRERLWLMIRAMNTTPTLLSAAMTSLNTPSYDVCIRQKTRYLAT